MKTLNEIKKGLECCTPVWAGNHWKSCNSNCPYIGLADSCRGQLVYDALAYIQQLEAKEPRWISVKERLPRTDEQVLLITNQGAYRIGKYSYTGREMAVWFRCGKSVVTCGYWMPLPEPPKEEL